MVRVVPNHCVNVKCEFSTEECGPNVDDLAPGEKEPGQPDQQQAVGPGEPPESGSIADGLPLPVR